MSMLWARMPFCTNSPMTSVGRVMLWGVGRKDHPNKIHTWTDGGVSKPRQSTNNISGGRLSGTHAFGGQTSFNGGTVGERSRLRVGSRRVCGGFMVWDKKNLGWDSMITAHSCTWK